MTFPDRVTRHARIKQPRDYLQARGNTLAEHRQVRPDELPFEFMLNALRLIDGFPVDLFRSRTGLPIGAIERALARAEEQGLLERDWRRIRPSERGRRFLNELVGLFLA